MTLLDLVARSDMLCVVPHPVLIPAHQLQSVCALKVREGLPRYEVCLFWRVNGQACNRTAIAAIVAALSERDGSPLSSLEMPP
jgi:hypothetical protein